MAYRKTDSITAEADANDAIEIAIKEAAALSRLDEKRRAKRARAGRWIARLSFLSSVVLFALAAAFKSHGVGVAAVGMLILSGGIALMRLGGGLSVQGESDQASVTRNIRG
ncbi:MAG: hypothetical protein AB8H86_25260 [Polyangiales bacterium]